jgi:hypothetical protein
MLRYINSRFRRGKPDNIKEDCHQSIPHSIQRSQKAHSIQRSQKVH